MTSPTAAPTWHYPGACPGGYDLATGWGTFQGAALLADLSGTSPPDAADGAVHLPRRPQPVFPAGHLQRVRLDSSSAACTPTCLDASQQNHTPPCRPRWPSPDRATGSTSRRPSPSPMPGTSVTDTAPRSLSLVGRLEPDRRPVPVPDRRRQPSDHDQHPDLFVHGGLGHRLADQQCPVPLRQSPGPVRSWWTRPGRLTPGVGYWIYATQAGDAPVSRRRSMDETSGRLRRGRAAVRSAGQDRHARPLLPAGAGRRGARASARGEGGLRRRPLRLGCECESGRRAGRGSSTPWAKSAAGRSVSSSSACTPCWPRASPSPSSPRTRPTSVDAPIREFARQSGRPRGIAWTRPAAWNATRPSGGSSSAAPAPAPSTAEPIHVVQPGAGSGPRASCCWTTSPKAAPPWSPAANFCWRPARRRSRRSPWAGSSFAARSDHRGRLASEAVLSSDSSCRRPVSGSQSGRGPSAAPAPCPIEAAGGCVQSR